MRWLSRLLQLLCWLLPVFAAVPVRAQQPTSYYSVTGIRTRTLPNAVQITIQTDGAVVFGTDLDEFLDRESGNFEPKRITSLRIRFQGARARVPAFVDIGQYPLDSAVTTLGTEPFVAPFFRSGGAPPSLARDPFPLLVDVQLRFFVPVIIRRFVYEDEDSGINFGGALNPGEVEIKMGPDRRSVIVTVISDRVETTRSLPRLRRSPPEDHNHRLNIGPVTAGVPSVPPPLLPARIRLDILHAPLADVLDQTARALGVPLAAQPDAATLDVSLFLPSAGMDEILRALRIGYGLAAMARTEQEGGGFIVGKAGVPTVTERVSLRYLAPTQARLLFPDFLLRSLRVDVENNALIVSGSPEVVARIRQDLLALDLPRPQVRIEAQAFEISNAEDARIALQAAYSGDEETETVNANAGTISVTLQEGQQRAFSAQLQALIAKGRARLVAKPFVVVASGASGTLFLGQTRFVPVLQTRQGVQQYQALQLPIGTTLTVQPSVGQGDDILLDLTPRISTVDAIEPLTGLPTLGIREVTSSLRVRPNEAVLVAGLDSDLDFKTRRRITPLGRIPLLGPLLSALFGARRDSESRTAFLILVTARLVNSSGEAIPKA